VRTLVGHGGKDPEPAANGLIRGSLVVVIVGILKRITYPDVQRCWNVLTTNTNALRWPVGHLDSSRRPFVAKTHFESARSLFHFASNGRPNPSPNRALRAWGLTVLAEILCSRRRLQHLPVRGVLAAKRKRAEIVLVGFEHFSKFQHVFGSRRQSRKDSSSLTLCRFCGRAERICDFQLTPLWNRRGMRRWLSRAVGSVNAGLPQEPSGRWLKLQPGHSLACWSLRLHVLNNRFAEFRAFKQFSADHQALKIIRDGFVGDSLLHTANNPIGDLLPAKMLEHQDA
jgi:hypothetical protein